MLYVYWCKCSRCKPKPRNTPVTWTSFPPLDSASFQVFARHSDPFLPTTGPLLFVPRCNHVLLLAEKQVAVLATLYYFGITIRIAEQTATKGTKTAVGRGKIKRKFISCVMGKSYPCLRKNVHSVNSSLFLYRVTVFTRYSHCSTRCDVAEMLRDRYHVALFIVDSTKCV